MQAHNLLHIISDEHRRDAMGCSGHPLVQTPTLDRLAARGTRFTSAYTPSPMCVPTRASIHTGRWVHELGTWSSAEPYEGKQRGWAHVLRDAGHRVSSIGKLHFRNGGPQNGFSEEIVPLYTVKNGWTLGLLRDPVPPAEVYAPSLNEFAHDVGRGPSPYTDYDLSITDEALKWLQARASTPDEKPWTLFLSYVSPHYPLVAPAEFYDLYDEDALDAIIGDAPAHPFFDAYLDFYNYDSHFDDERRRKARAAYYGLCSFLDAQIGRVITQLEATGLIDTTRIVYTSDHGELLGDHGQWTKMSMYEASAGVPLIMAGPDVPEGQVCNAPVSLVSTYKTVTDCMGFARDKAYAERQGDSFVDIATGDASADFTFCEYHDGGAANGYYMIRWQQWKYVYYVGYRPQLFDLDADPNELVDRGADPETAEVRAHCEGLLRSIVDPEQVSAHALADQAQRIEQLGGRDAILTSTANFFSYTPIGNHDE